MIASPGTAAATAIQGTKARLAAEATERHFRRRPELERRFGAAGRSKCEEDAGFHLSYLAEAIAFDEPELFAQYAVWAASMLKSRGVPVEDLIEDLREIAGVVSEAIPDAAMPARAAVEAAARVIASPAADGTVAALPLAARYLDAALNEGPLEAGHVVDEAIGAGLSPARVCTEILQPAMYALGVMWQTNQISAADEHYCTAITQRVLNRLLSDNVAGPARGPRVIIACASGDLHQVGAQMLAELLRLEGFRAEFLGASTPSKPLIEYACKRDARILALSASTTPHLRSVREAIALARSNSRCADLKIMVGGGAFNGLPRLWQQIGADAWAPDAAAAVVEAHRLA